MNREDFILRLKLDSSQLEKEYPKTFAKLSKAQQRQNKQIKAEQMVLKGINAERLRGVSISKQQERLTNKIKRAEEQGVKNLERFRQMAKSSRRDVLGQADVGLSQRLRRASGTPGAQNLSTDVDILRNRSSNITDPRLRGRASQLNSELGSIGERTKAAKTTQEVRRLRAEFSRVKSEINKAERAQDKFNRTLKSGNAVSRNFTKSLRGMALGLTGAYAVLGGAKQAFAIGKNLDSMKAGLLAASGSAEVAKQNFKFLRETSQTLGTDIEVGAGSFNRLAVAAKGAGFSTSEIREIYLSAAEASTTFGLSTEKQSLVMLAFSQIMSKGKVSMEELSRQLGENFPIAMEAGSKAMGVSTEELIKMVSSGKLLAKDFMLPFARQIRGQIRDSGAYEASLKKVNASLGRMKNAFKFLINDIFEGGLGSGFSSLFNGIADFVTNASPAFLHFWQGFSSMLGGVAQGLSIVFSSLTETTGAMGDSARSVGLLTRMWSGFAATVLFAMSGYQELLALVYDLEGTTFGKIFSSSLGGFGGITAGAADFARNASGAGTKNETINSGGNKTEITINAGSADARQVNDILVDQMGL